MELATPTSAMQPPSAALIVAPRLTSMPMAEALRMKVQMSRCGSEERKLRSC